MARIFTHGHDALIAPASWPLKVAAVVAGSLLLWLSAKVQVPFWPVPMTLHTLAIFLLMAVLGPALGLAAVVLYVVEGALGLPVFAGTPEKGLGIAYMMGPTGGYILGFVLAAAAMGWLMRKGLHGSPLKLFAVFMAGLALIYIPGLLWLANFFGFDKVLTLGFWPFIGGDVLKAAIVALAVPTARRLLKRAA